MIPENVARWRERIAERGGLKKGDKIHSIAAPIAAAIDKAIGTNISGCGGCKKMRERLNAGMSLAEASKKRVVEWASGKF
jgi:hypothetical protein